MLGDELIDHVGGVTAPLEGPALRSADYSCGPDSRGDPAGRSADSPLLPATLPHEVTPDLPLGVHHVPSVAVWQGSTLGSGITSLLVYDRPRVTPPLCIRHYQRVTRPHRWFVCLPVLASLWGAGCGGEGPVGGVRVRTRPDCELDERDDPNRRVV